jgi:hypothetical protein
MKDIPHHMKKLNRRVIRSMHREEVQEERLPDVPTFPETKRQKRKKAKIKMRDETRSHPPTSPTPEERNKIMKKGRVPVFDRTNNLEPKHTRSSKKKTPRI